MPHLQGALAKERRDQKIQAQREQESQSQRAGLSSSAKINDPMADISLHSSALDIPGPSQRQRVWQLLFFLIGFVLICRIYLIGIRSYIHFTVNNGTDKY